MKNRAQLMHLVDRAERGALLPGEAVLLRDALNLLDDLATTLDKLMGTHPGDYETEATGQIPVISLTTPNPARPWDDCTRFDHP